MSQQLVVCLIAVATNVAVMFVIYSFLALLLARLAWNGRGVPGIIVTIVVAQLFWIALVIAARDFENPSSLALWFGNWLVCGFAIVLLARTAKRIPHGLADAARLDGLGSFATLRHVVLPFAGRDLALIALFTIMATLLPFWAFINLPEAGKAIIVFQRFFSVQGRIAMMIAGSLVGALPLIAIFFMAKRQR